MARNAVPQFAWSGPDAHVLNRRRSAPAFCCLSLLFAAWGITGCSESAGPDPASVTATPTAAPPQTPPASPPSKERIAEWLASDLPPLVDGVSDPPVRLSQPVLEPNEFGQEILSVDYERPTIVRTAAADLSLVLLPVTGGRANVFLNPGTLIEPRTGGKLRGITENLLDHRGRLGSGMRAYVEMHAATVPSGNRKAERVSDVLWFGSEEQLFNAVRTGPPARVGENAKLPAPALQPVPAGLISKGTPLWMRCGDRWARGSTLEDSDGEPLKMLIYLVRRDKPYLPWTVEQPRSELRIEPAALAEFQQDPKSFRDLAEANQLKLSRHGVPNRLELIVPDNLPVGTAVLDFWNGMLDPCRSTGPVQNGAVPLQRVGLDNAQMTKDARQLFIDPFGEPAAP